MLVELLANEGGCGDDGKFGGWLSFTIFFLGKWCWCDCICEEKEKFSFLIVEEQELLAERWKDENSVLLFFVASFWCSIEWSDKFSISEPVLCFVFWSDSSGEEKEEKNEVLRWVSLSFVLLLFWFSDGEGGFKSKGEEAEEIITGLLLFEHVGLVVVTLAAYEGDKKEEGGFFKESEQVEEEDGEEEQVEKWEVTQADDDCKFLLLLVLCNCLPRGIIDVVDGGLEADLWFANLAFESVLRENR